MQICMRFPQGKTKALTLNYDDGIYQDIKLVSIMKKYGIRGTFNINSGIFKDSPNDYRKGNRMTREETVKTFKDSGMEIAVHGLYHDHMTTNPSVMTAYDFFTERENLEEMFGTIVRGMAYPYGSVTDRMIEAMKTAGLVYGRTVNETHKFDIPINNDNEWFRITTTCHHRDPKLMEIAEKFINEKATIWPEIFCVWGHSYEFDMHNNWDVIENFCEKMSGKEDIWYTTYGEIHDYFYAYNRLVFSVDGGSVYNPNAKSIWLCYDGQTIELLPGSTTVFEKEKL